MILSVEETKELLDVAKGKKAGSLLLKNVRLLDVYGEKIYPASILMKNGRIVAVNPSESCYAEREIDGNNLIALPGFVDPHFHIDSTQGTPASLAEAIVPWGTTTLCGEILDITHFAGIYGKGPVETAKAFLKEYERFPYRLLPLAPGKMSDSKVTEELMDWEGTFGLGEVLSHNILCQEEPYLNILHKARKEGKFISGHILHIVWDFPDDDVKARPLGFRQMSDDEINQFAIMGYPHDHEIFNYEGVDRILSRGMSPLVRTFEGLAKRVMSGVLNDHVPTENISFCMDDLFLQDIKMNGHLNLAVQQAIDLGISPIKAIKMATLNTAKNIGLEREVGSLAPGRFADILLVPSLSDITPRFVYKGGELVAKDGHLIEDVHVDYSELQWKWEKHLEELAKEDLAYEPTDQELSADKKTARVPVYHVIKRIFEEKELRVVEGKVLPDVSRDIIRAVVVDRNDTRKVIKLFISGFNLKEGAMAINFNQNIYRIIAVGLEVGPMLAALKKIDQHLGGMVVVDKEEAVVEFLELDIAAVASSRSCHDIVSKVNAMEEKIKTWGVDIDNALMILWFTGFLYLWD